MAVNDSYKVVHTLYDITVGSQAAQQQLDFDATGRANSTNYATSNVLTTSALNGAALGEVWALLISPPRSSTGAYEDLREVWPRPDGTDLSKYIDISGVGTSLMAPEFQRVAHGRDRLVVLGQPLWKLCEAGKRHNVPNMPLQSTTLKFANFMALSSYAKSAITGGGTGYRIRALGFLYTKADLDYLAPGWQGAVQVQTVGRAMNDQRPLSFTYDASWMTPDGWVAGPGGTAQGTVKINKYLKHAINAVASGTASPFYLTNQGPASNTGNVENNRQDLYIPKNARLSLVVQGYGVVTVTRPSHIGRTGFFIEGTEVPNNASAPGPGQFISDDTNPLYFGDDGPYHGTDNTSGLSGHFEPIPRVMGEEILIRNESFVPFIAADGTGSTIPADSTVVAVSGVMVEGV